MSERTENNEDNDEFSKRWSGFDFCRLSGVVILTFIFVAAALFIDELSFASKREEQCYNLTLDPDCNNVHTCKVTGRCGWRIGKWKYTKLLYSNLNLNSDPFIYCGSLDSAAYNNHQGGVTIESEYSLGYAKGCNYNAASELNEYMWDSSNNQKSRPLEQMQKDSCLAYNAGNIWLIFNIASLIINIFTMILLLPLYCRHKSCFPCEWCNKYTAIILGALFGATWICQLIASGYWMAMQPCDSADALYRFNFTQPTTNVLSYSVGLVLISVVANCVACGTVCFCWGDNRVYGEDPNETDKEYAIKPSSKKDPFKTTEDKYGNDDGGYN